MNAQADYRSIEAAIEQGNLKLARALLRPALRAYPEDAQVWYLAARAAVNEAQQRHFLEQAIQRDPSHAQATEALAELNGSNPDTPIESDQAYTVSLATISARLAAGFVDTLIVMAAASSFVLLLNVLFAAPLLDDDSIEPSIASLWIAAGFLGGAIVYGAYYIYFLTRWEGQTPGKRAFSLRVRHTDGTSLTAWDAFVRCYIGYLALLMTLGIGFLISLRHPNRQGWHDRLADTVVIRDSSRPTKDATA